MKAKTIGTQRDVTLMVSLMGAAGLLAASAAPVSADTLFNQFNLVSDIPGLAHVTDPNLVNSWGISESPKSPFWISDNGTGLSTLYIVPGSGTPPVTIASLVVTIPGAVPLTTSAPTGQVFNSLAGSNAFKLNNGNPAAFLFDSEDGAISGWNGGTSAEIKVEQCDLAPSTRVWRSRVLSGRHALRNEFPRRHHRRVRQQLHAGPARGIRRPQLAGRVRAVQ